MTLPALLLSAALAMPAQPVSVEYTDVAAVHQVTVPAIPAPQGRPRALTVAAGDTLSKLARKLELPSWHPLFDANPNVRNPNLIFPGQRLRVPQSGEQFKRRSTVTTKRVVKKRVVRRNHTVSTRRIRRTTTNFARGNTVWDRLAACESSGNWAINTGNGFYGGLQFTLDSWRATGGSGMPHHASRSEQIRRAQILLQMQGWGAWPACSSKLGLR